MMLLLCCALGGTLPSPTNAQDSDREARITSAFVFNFCNFTTWPEPPLEELRLTVLDSGHFTDAYHDLAGKKVGPALLDVAISDKFDTLTGVQALFISASEKDQVSAMLSQVAGRPVLTISNAKGFCDMGGMVEIVKIKNKLKFVINLAAARKAGLNISSQLLKMAVRVVQEG